MRVPIDIFLAHPLVTSLELPPFRTRQMRYVYRLLLDGSKPDDELLEEAFRLLNVEHPPDYRQRSFSMGDVVTIAGARSYRCKAVGWQRLERPLLPRCGLREAHPWLAARRRQLWQKLSRLLCKLRGCQVAQRSACARCGTFVYDPELLGPSVVRRIVDKFRALRRKCLHRCEVCDFPIWFSEERCCSKTCYEESFPF
jgi:hypothetical protein